MAKAKKKDQPGSSVPQQPRPFWSGVIAFGLVSLPVSLFPANKAKPLSLKMVARDGTPLQRRYFCEKEQRVLTQDQIVRGYEVEKDRYVVVKDDELESVAPEKSREIDLQRFVSLADINPVYYERGYFLAPDSGATKAYRLLAKSMEDAQRAGVATFVMRDKEYIIAIIAEDGILRAQTLRFHDEIRSPGDIGLPTRKAPPRKQVRSMTRTMESLAARQVNRSTLRDRQMQRLRDGINAKLKSGEDVVRLPEATREEAADEAGADVIDLMQVLKDRLQGRRTKARRANGEQRDTGLGELTRDELYERARELEIPGRSNMSKQQLVKALSESPGDDT